MHTSLKDQIRQHCWWGRWGSWRSETSSLGPMQHYPSPSRKCVKLSHELSILIAPWCGSLTHSDPISVLFAWCERIFVCALKCCTGICGAVQRAPQSPVKDTYTHSPGLRVGTPGNLRHMGDMQRKVDMQV